MNLVSVVIPATSYDLNLKKCLASLVLQKNIKLEVWVVFNPQLPQVNESEWPDWIHFTSSAKGVNYARNKGLRKSSSDFVYFFDSDCELADEFHINKAVEGLLSRPGSAGIGGGYTLAGDASLPSQAYQYLQITWLQEQIQNHEMQSGALIGGNMLLRKSKLAGLEFDETILFGGSEREFFIRLMKFSPLLYLDFDLNVIHNSCISEKQLLKKAKAQSSGEMYIKSKHADMHNKTIQYLLKPALNPTFASYVEKYQQVFTNNSRTIKKRSFVNEWLITFIQHLDIAQSRRD